MTITTQGERGQEDPDDLGPRGAPGKGDYSRSGYVFPRKWLTILLAIAAVIAIELALVLIFVVPQIGTNNDQNGQISKQNSALLVQNHQLVHLAHENHRLVVQIKAGVCTLRTDLETRVETAKAFLREHPNGAFGFSAASIRSTYEGQERTINALDVVNCGSG